MRHLFKVLTPRLAEGQRVAVTGNIPALGNWNLAKAVEMHCGGIPLWSAYVDVESDAEYKFIIIDGEQVTWEDGPNRHLTIAHSSTVPLCHSTPLNFRGLPKWKASGVAVPVFSLRSEDDFGCGDFEDLKLLADWAAETGMQVIQVLPVNDTTLTGTAADSYPYSAISSFALHPLYLRPQLLGEPKDPEEFKKLQKMLNAVDTVDYPAVIAAKEEYAHHIYKECGSETILSPEFSSWLAANSDWLLPYCFFRTLNNLKNPKSPTAADAFFYAWLQYQLHLQLKSACDYARSLGVAIKGDIPIGVSANGVDAWQHPELFNLDMSAGAPPDAFAKDGQNWGFPTYNWERMAQDGYAWWRKRLQHMSQYFDAFRIDHILGFFRIWEIPAGVSSGLLGHFSPALPLSKSDLSDLSDLSDNSELFIEDPRNPGYYHPRILGYETEAFRQLSSDQQAAYRALYEDFFYRRHNDFWAESALKKLPALVDATPMLACAEDLGMIPACVPEVLDGLQILALEVQRMPKQYGVSIANPAEYSWLNVATTSTHDMPPLRLWLEQSGSDSAPEACAAFVEQHTASPAMLTILPLQDWLAIDGKLRRPIAAEEQINIPAMPNHYWRYRMHITLEKMLKSAAFNAKVVKLTALR
ncbi:MAG: 4-alpha-glucanotransferase [Bacteroides sp.]|nr:4-alpha-glucanotransferase [Bacteroides sp.]MCM1378752.1 4-alpha-glucanotransferase [Bacteroides sp.]MCM1445369.1 4-alpha-glucanotransferase [Prevotella sp.]